MSVSHSDHESFALRHRGGVLLERYNIDLFLHPHLGFSIAPGHRSASVNTDNEGFRLSDSPFGPVDSAGWLAAGGGGLVIGNSGAFGMAATCDEGTTPSYLAHLSGTRQLNLGLVGGNSVQELIAAMPFLDHASTVVVYSGVPDYWSTLASWDPYSPFGPMWFEGTLTSLINVPVLDLERLVEGEPLPEGSGERKAKTAVKPDFSDVEERVAAAARRQLRSLESVAKLAGHGAKVLFALQPFATPRTREITKEEQANFDFEEPMFGRPENHAYEQYWDLFAGLIAKGCADLGVPYMNMTADLFEGFCFSDHIHLNDEGNRQAAQMIHTMLKTLPDLSAE